jgi:guanylate kinase
MANVVPPLKHKEDFKTVLANYQPKQSAQALFDKLRFVVLSGVAAGGRNTVINYLVEHADYYFIVSDTTRPPKLRDGKMEQNGVQYWFRDEAEMLADIKKGKFLEAELIHNQQVSGTSLRELEKAANADKTAIAEVEFGGANNIVAIDPNVFAIGILPPSYQEWLKRFRSRETITDEEFYNRLQTAEKVLNNVINKPYFHIVINDDVKQCAEDIQKVVAGTYTQEAQSNATEVAKAMLVSVEKHLQVLQAKS